MSCLKSTMVTMDVARKPKKDLGPTNRVAIDLTHSSRWQKQPSAMELVLIDNFGNTDTYQFSHLYVGREGKRERDQYGERRRHRPATPIRSIGDRFSSNSCPRPIRAGLVWFGVHPVVFTPFCRTQSLAHSR